MKNSILALSLLFAAFCVSVPAQAPDRDKVIAGAERAFDKAVKAITAPAPGCAVGVSLNGESVFEKAFGLAEMEHNVSNTPLTIFESGSVAKQFTAASLVLLQLDGKLNLDDPVRKYIPELPEYGSPLTIRHMLNHTAGLRDWGTVMALTGAGRGDRVISQDLAFDVITHQKYLDFKPGAEYSYSNSGYNLAAIIVERVSKQKFADFVTERLFKPLKMTNSSIRDDYTRVVPGRAQAYSRAGNGPWQLDMPFMNVYGNGGMLTTVADWLKWNAMLDSRSMGGPLVDALETQGILNDGRKITYALGLVVDNYKGLRSVSHNGATAGYQTFLARYPDKKLSVAVLCNGTSPSATGLGTAVADEILGPFPSPTPAPAAAEVKAEDLQKFAGLWRSERTHTASRTTVENGTLRLNGLVLRPNADGTFQLGAMRIIYKLDKDGKPVSSESNNNGDISRYFAEQPWTPTATELASIAGEWYSEEAGATFTLTVDGGKASLKQRPATSLALTPLYKDHFTVQGGYVAWVTRDASGKVDQFHVGAGRMRDMLFVRVKK